ncbi:MAG: hypothetical protein WC663_04340 [Patescibacteria group bacterium]|jgi:hypothetical protein
MRALKRLLLTYLLENESRNVEAKKQGLVIDGRNNLRICVTFVDTTRDPNRKPITESTGFYGV